MEPSNEAGASVQLELVDLEPDRNHTVVVEVEAPVRVWDFSARLENGTAESNTGFLTYDRGKRRTVLTAKPSREGTLSIALSAPIQPWEKGDQIKVTGIRLLPQKSG